MHEVKDKDLLADYYEKLGVLILFNSDELNNLSELNLTLEDAENYFNKCLDMKSNEKIILLYVSMIYDLNDNDEKFYFYLKESLDLGYDNFDQLEYNIFDHRSKSERFINLLKEYKK